MSEIIQDLYIYIYYTIAIIKIKIKCNQYQTHIMFQLACNDIQCVPGLFLANAQAIKIENPSKSVDLFFQSPEFVRNVSHVCDG